MLPLPGFSFLDDIGDGDAAGTCEDIEDIEG